jgi:hypothetical protein
MSKPEQTTDEHSDVSGIPDGSEVDWRGLWDEFNFDEDYIASNVQLRLAVDVSDRTGHAGEGDAVSLAEDAAEAGLLVSEPAKTAETACSESRWITKGYSLPER